MIIYLRRHRALPIGRRSGKGPEEANFEREATVIGGVEMQKEMQDCGTQPVKQQTPVKRRGRRSRTIKRMIYSNILKLQSSNQLKK